MEIRGVLRPAAASLVFLFFVCAAEAQDHSTNRPDRPANAAATATHPSAEEKILLDAANRERDAEGLQPLRWDSTLAEAARQHVQAMVSQNLLLHQCLNEPPLEQRAALAGAKFSAIAENIAVGPNAEVIHEGWMHSPGHRKNILSSDVTAIGIATMRSSGGLFAVQDFSRPAENLSLTQQEERVVALLKDAKLRTVEITEDARRTCRMDGELVGEAGTFIFRFSAIDLSALPERLLQKVKTREFHKAAVGSCEGGDAGVFTRYRLAVLLN